MDSPGSAFTLLILAGGVATVLFMLRQILATLRDGTLERRPPLPPFTRKDTRIAFWFFVAIMVLGAAGITWGLVVIALELRPHVVFALKASA